MAVVCHDTGGDMPSEESKAARLVVEIGNISQPWEKKDIKLMTEQGVGSCEFFWAKKHDDHCEVEFEDSATALKVYQKLSGLEIGGKALTTRIAQPQGRGGLPMDFETQPQPEPELEPEPAKLSPTPASVSNNTGVTTTNTTQAAVIPCFQSNLIGDYPRQWVYRKDTPDVWSRFLFDAWRVEILPFWQQQGIDIMPTVAPSGQSFVSRHYAAPSPNNRHAAGKVMTAIKLPSQEPQVAPEYRMVALDTLPEWQSKGWELWVHPEDPTHGDLMDPRDCEPINDTTDDRLPLKETARLFEKQIALARAEAGSGSSPWEPGQLISGQACPANAPSMSRQFQPVATLSEQNSATSSGHIHRHPRPSQVNVGWGDYDMYHSWQSAGRIIDEEDVVNKKWSEDAKNEPLEFIFDEVTDEQGNTVEESWTFKIPPFKDIDNDIESELGNGPPLQSLCEKLNPKNTEKSP
ncbi:hypothetical protein F5X99DRAFT_414809 [Biscogniauxia marginata]|nr:hypothetical protein F5X99DRAFT_414809 [Biscogniauxia marginata]